MMQQGALNESLTIIPRHYRVRFEPKTHRKKSLDNLVQTVYLVAILLRILRQEFVCKEDEYWATFTAEGHLGRVGNLFNKSWKCENQKVLKSQA